MKRDSLLLLAFLGVLLTACGGGSDAAPASDDDDAGAEVAAEAPAAAETGEAVGRCAVDARDGAPYGRIASAETDAGSGEQMYRIEGEGGATWNKKASNVRVVDCP